MAFTAAMEKLGMSKMREWQDWFNMQHQIHLDREHVHFAHYHAKRKGGMMPGTPLYSKRKESKYHLWSRDRSVHWVDLLSSDEYDSEIDERICSYQKAVEDHIMELHDLQQQQLPAVVIVAAVGGLVRSSGYPT